MTENPVDPVHDDHGEDPDQDAGPPSPTHEMPAPEAVGQEHPAPPPGDDGS